MKKNRQRENKNGYSQCLNHQLYPYKYYLSVRAISFYPIFLDSFFNIETNLSCSSFDNIANFF